MTRSSWNIFLEENVIKTDKEVQCQAYMLSRFSLL